MRSFQRALRSLIRKPVRSTLLFFVVLIISLFLLAGMSSHGVSVQTQDDTRQAVGAGFRLDINDQNRTKRLTAIASQIGEAEGTLQGVHQKKWETAAGTQWQVWTDHSFETLHLADIKAIAAVDGIADYNMMTVTTVVMPINFSRMEDAQNDQSKDVGGVALIGNRKMALDFNVLSGNVTIKEGRMVTDTDQDVCVISEQLAEQNGLAVGDIMQFGKRHDSTRETEAAAEIIGIYQTKQYMSPLMSGDTYRSENIIFTDLHFPEKAEGVLGDTCYEHAYFQVADVDQYAQVKAAVQQVDIDWERYDLLDRNGNLSMMSSNFYDLEQIGRLFLLVIFGASFAILILVFLFWLKNRAREIGILHALGVSKSSILGQILIEALLLAVLAFSVSLLLAPQTAHFTVGYLVNQQAEQAELQEQVNAAHVAKDFVEPKQTVVGVQVSITASMIAICGGSIIFLIITSVGAAGISVLRKKPNEILQELH